MCGIVGGLRVHSNLDLTMLARNMTSSLRHRGPDAQDHLIDGRVFVGNCRLSVIDIAGGSQPFVSRTSGVSVVFNGEVYNYIELREELRTAGAVFESESDTEVILRGYEIWGIDFVQRLNGMFAIAVLDPRNGRLLLARDRLGVKPLYLLRSGRGIFFASEVKSFLRIPEFTPVPNLNSLGHYLFFNFVPQPLTAFRDIQHVPPATVMTFELQSNAESCRTYWSLDDAEEASDRIEADVVDSVDSLIRDAIRIRLRSDVPVSIFLSSGLDSSMVAAITRSIASMPLTAFSVQFADPAFDEAAMAKELCNSFQWLHRARLIVAEDIDKWSATTWSADQPHGDISFVPFYLLAEEAAKSFKVALTGDGGDEVFGGYDRYRSLLDPACSPIDLVARDSLLGSVDGYRHLSLPCLEAEWVPAMSLDLARRTMNQVSRKESLNKILYWDMCQLLPGNNLVKPDKMAMAHGLEVRSPFLDYRLWDFMMELPSSFKVTANGTRLLQRSVARRYLNEEIVSRGKRMLAVPSGPWLRDKLRGRLETLVRDHDSLVFELVNRSVVTRFVTEHVDGAHDHRRILRALLNLDMWFRQFCGGIGLSPS